MRIAILTLSIGEKFKEKMKYAILSKVEYCKKHKYDLIDDESVYDKTRPIAWSKILLIKKYLPMYDYVFWIDADAIILNFEHRLEDKIFLLNGKDICITTVFGMINTGVILLKNTENSMRFVNLVYDQTQFLEDGNWEQTAIIHIYENNISDMKSCIELKYEEKYHLQCYLKGLYAGVFIVHLAGFREDSYTWLVNKIFERLYPLRRENESIDHYSLRKIWYNNSLEKSIEDFYNNSCYSFIEY